MELQSSVISRRCQPDVKGKLTLQVHLPLILGCVRDGYTQNRIADLLGVSKQAISKLMKRLIQHEYLRLDVRSSCNIYQILPRGQLVLSGGRKLFEAGIGRLHGIRYKYPILSGEFPRDRWKRVEMVNWTKLVGDVYGAKVEASERSVIVSPGIFFGYNMVDLLPKAKEVADAVADRLRGWFKLELGVAKSVGRPEWAVLTPLPSLALSGVNLRRIDSWLDASRGVAEVEFTDMEQAQQFIDMPKKLEEIMASLQDHRNRTEVNQQSPISQPQVNEKSTILQRIS